MSPDKNVADVFRSFHERRINKLTVYLEGFGGFFFGRAKDGFVTGYIDRNKQFGVHDHVTVLLGKNGLEGLHRKVSDVETDVYVKFEPTYLSSPEGFQKLVQTMQGRKDMKTSEKVILALVYKMVGIAYVGTEKMGQEARLLDPSEALKRGLRPPCVYLKPSFLQKLLLQIIREDILLQRYLTDLILGKYTTRAFAEMNIPGTIITKRRRPKLSA